MKSTPLAISITKRQGRNQYYDEVLMESFLPLRMMLIPAGSFIMGSPENELERSYNEGPQHEVKLSQFFMSKYPVTQAQWRVVALMPQVNRELEPDPSSFKGDKLPVDKVSWHDAVEFCDRLTVHTNLQYRLPTEAEWEYACRAGTTTPFHFGKSITTDVANYCGQDRIIGGTQSSGSYGNGPEGENRQKTTPVDYFEGANAFGLYDMHGNVWEWCQDPWHDNYEKAPTDGRVWLTRYENAFRVRRGGACFSYPGYCRSACREDSGPENRDVAVGLRVCCSASRAQALSDKSASVQVAVDAASFQVPNPESYNLPTIE